MTSKNSLYEVRITEKTGRETVAQRVASRRGGQPMVRHLAAQGYTVRIVKVS